MTPSSLRRRVAGTAATVFLIGAGAVATAPSAAAKANLLSIDSVSRHTPGLQVKVTYSCDVGMDHELVANATTLNHSPHDQSIAAGTVKKDRLVCDYHDHVALVTLRPAAGSHFDKGDKVEVTVFYFDNDGFRYADQEKAAVL
ncbi:hypothetical protein [Streptomyces alanosinicus]|uniref:DUF4333 domain-containing protein n=1 Tax=Streptomyces alanosinicus TaxID=68171 RepID=A0A918YII9_9ACTN|nr:hypothetical protein [Streptomyces alanosinicus]GHE04474.1 hypothetical protein GCM10010339_36160 [Streptomyces alanosinicus]